MRSPTETNDPFVVFPESQSAATKRAMGFGERGRPACIRRRLADGTARHSRASCCESSGSPVWRSGRTPRHPGRVHSPEPISRPIDADYKNCGVLKEALLSNISGAKQRRESQARNRAARRGSTAGSTTDGVCRTRSVFCERRHLLR